MSLRIPPGRLLLALAMLSCFSGCAAVQVRVANPARVFSREFHEAVAGIRSESTSDRTAQHKLAMEAAKAHWAGAISGNPTSLALYNAAVGSLIASKAGLAKTRNVQLAEGLHVDTRHGLDPLQADLIIPAAAIKIGRLSPRAASPGLGVPCVMVFPPDAPWLRGQPGIPGSGLSIPGTAVLSFPSGRPTLTFVPTLERTTFAFGKKKIPVATDFSAALAILVARGPNRSLDLGTMLLTAARMDRARLLQIEPLHSKKIPVILVHGLMSRPETWSRLLNALQADPVLRGHYQCWLFMYPTGLSVWSSAAILRQELERFDSAWKALGGPQIPPRKILVGHSMGGLISSLMIREGGPHLWSQFSDVPFEKALQQPSLRPRLLKYAQFHARQDVDRVIFAAVPHRGAPMAHRPIASLAAGLIRLPAQVDRWTRRQFLFLLRDDTRKFLTVPANSIRFLRSNSPLVLSILNLPRNEAVAIHSIVGNRGRPGPLEDSSDGVVPYWSAHLDFASSEKIVPSGHGAHEHPEGIAEILRILHLHRAAIRSR